MQARDIFFAILVAWGLSATAQADTLAIEAVDQAANVARPSKGQSMSAVEAQYGKPKQVVPAVGQPPITRWIYDGFTVYFEGDTVIHSVVNR